VIGVVIVSAAAVVAALTINAQAQSTPLAPAGLVALQKHLPPGSSQAAIVAAKIAAAQRAELSAPAPTNAPPVPMPASAANNSDDATGIDDTGNSGPFPAAVFLVANTWRGSFDGRALTVYAGTAEGDTPALRVYAGSDTTTPPALVGNYPSQAAEKSGDTAVRITEVNGSAVVLSTGETFDLNTMSFAK